jgi:hypothetical protein
LALVALGVAWTCIDQMGVTKAPVAMASEAPERHLRGRETFTRKDAYDFSFALGEDIRGRLPNVLFPLAPTLAGVWLISRYSIAAKRRDDTTRPI